MGTAQASGQAPEPRGAGVASVRTEAEDLRLFGPRGEETLLLVEDEVMVRWSLGQLLEARGYRVLQAASAEEALDVAERSSEPIHLLLSDVFMPGLDGFELAHRLRRARPGLRALLMTGFADEALRRQAREDVIVKPFTALELALAVRSSLDRK